MMVSKVYNVCMYIGEYIYIFLCIIIWWSIGSLIVWVVLMIDVDDCIIVLVVVIRINYWDGKNGYIGFIVFWLFYVYSLVFVKLF